MSKLAFYLFCAQVFIVQVYSQSCGCGQSLNQANYGNSYGSGLFGSNIGSCGSNIGYGSISSGLIGSNYGYGLGLGSSAGSNSISTGLVGSSNGAGSGSGFGATGTGQLAIEGGIPITGNTYIDGNLPIIGLVEFNGNLPASGIISVSGCTPCDCSQYSFGY